MRSANAPAARRAATIFIVATALGGLAAASGCGGVGPDERSGGDAGRGDARAAALDTLLYDRVGVDDGDSTDWKSFKIEEEAKVTIAVWWDDPKAIAASLELRDSDAKSLTKMAHKKGEQSEKMGPIKLKEGTYFLRVHASAGASVYSFEITSGSGGGEDAVPDL